MTLFRTKKTKDPKKVEPWKKSKPSNTSLDLITLTEGDLNDIGDTVWDATAEMLQQFEQQQQQALGAIQMGLRKLQIHVLSLCDFEDQQDKVHKRYIKPLKSLGPSLPGLREGYLYVIMI